MRTVNLIITEELKGLYFSLIELTYTSPPPLRAKTYEKSLFNILLLINFNHFIKLLC